MSKPLILDLLERVKALETEKQNKEWKSKTVSIPINGSTTIEELKNANEVIVILAYGSATRVAVNYPKTISGKWYNSVSYDAGIKNYSFYISFDTGYVQNSTDGYTQLTIETILWR